MYYEQRLATQSIKEVEDECQYNHQIAGNPQEPTASRDIWNQAALNDQVYSEQPQQECSPGVRLEALPQHQPGKNSGKNRFAGNEQRHVRSRGYTQSTKFEASINDDADHSHQA